MFLLDLRFQAPCRLRGAVRLQELVCWRANELITEALVIRMGLQLQQWVRTCSCSWPQFLSVGEPASMCAKCCWGCVSCWQQSLVASVIVYSRDGFLGAPHVAQGDPVGAPVCWDGIASPRVMLYLPSVFSRDALYRIKVCPGNTWESYETLSLLLVMPTSLQSQVSLILIVQGLVCNTVLALWRCESAQLCKIPSAGTALMTWHLVKIWKSKFNFSLTGQEDMGSSCARGG